MADGQNAGLFHFTTAGYAGIGVTQSNVVRLLSYGPPEMKARFKEISPLHNITSNAPPTLFLLGTRDEYIPVKTAELFKLRMEQCGGRCELKLFPGAGHPIYEWRKGASPLRAEVLAAADKFLGELELLPNQTK